MTEVFCSHMFTIISLTSAFTRTMNFHFISTYTSNAKIKSWYAMFENLSKWKNLPRLSSPLNIQIQRWLHPY